MDNNSTPRIKIKIKIKSRSEREGWMISNLEGGGGMGRTPPKVNNDVPAVGGALVGESVAEKTGKVKLIEGESLEVVVTGSAMTVLKDVDKFVAAIEGAMATLVKDGVIEVWPEWPFEWGNRSVVVFHELKPVEGSWSAAAEVGFGRFVCVRCGREAAMNIPPGDTRGPEVDEVDGTAPAFEEGNIERVDGAVMDGSFEKAGLRWRCPKPRFCVKCYCGRKGA